METKIVQSVVTRCKRNDIRNILLRWGLLRNSEVDEINFLETKREIVSSLLSLCEQKKKFKSQVHDLDLIYMQTYSSKKKWSVFHISFDKGYSDGQAATLNPRTFKNKIKSQVALYFTAGSTVAVNMYEGALWARLYIPKPGDAPSTKGVYQPNNAVYFLYYPHTSYIVISAYKASIQEYLFQVLKNALQVSKLTNIQLTGHHVHSLVQLALNKNSQGSFAQYNDRDHQRAPLASLQPRKRKAQEFDRNENILCENQASKKKRAQLLEDNFGPNEQPTLEKVEYNVDVMFRATDIVPEMSYRSEAFKCKVKFEGPSVLDGFRDLGTMGVASVPLPTHLGKVHSMAKNSFTIQDKKPTQQKKKR